MHTYKMQALYNKHHKMSSRIPFYVYMQLETVKKFIEGDIGDLQCRGVAHFLVRCYGERNPSLWCCGDLKPYSVCDVCILKSTVFGEKKLSGVFLFHNFWTNDFSEKLCSCTG